MGFENRPKKAFFKLTLLNSAKILENKIKPAFIGGFVYLGWGFANRIVRDWTRD